MTEPTIAGVKPGLRVVITAGASGIGRVVAETLRAHGAKVHVCDVSQEALDACRKALPDVGTHLADVADVKQVDKFFDAALGAMGGLDVLVNNAGIAGPTAGVEDIDPAEWDRTIAINLNGQFYSARRAVPALRKTQDGAIINMSSVAGRFGYAYRTPYAATKWAIVGFTESLAKELGPVGIRVNAILPGIVEGPRIERVISARAQATGVSYEAMKNEYLGKVSLRRMVSPQDVANMVLFLCSPAGRNISGQSLSVCGNVEAL
ncbi:MAG TPA: SDR family oxidoreductase [Hypericibacter adhaerens]|jgi:NAD(P)-dependent dehydrogenase (short-subunit alcohol dehydrogenase family)|uniref:Short-chain dehydrogenase/reductase n=1 Tax=Hypericibacter adhaerens TaxID=2602016 RepID=A0A5J6N2K0_9PROT|nr:SDR family oxidoreductase [Hypericibacter adhaerens]QEX24182.1 short-chain dehydrogenase/reductase [Hypericibacter adhaerens]HWA41936.1 SDR family oxidoreductase [Hypericibacter adhaerens]